MKEELIALYYRTILFFVIPLAFVENMVSSGDTLCEAPNVRRVFFHHIIGTLCYPNAPPPLRIMSYALHDHAEVIE